MDEERAGLKGLLRTQLTAVNQQFVHILALRSWGEREAADRINAVDRIDFPVCMKILNHLVVVGEPLALEFSAFAPGDTLQKICAAELEIERRMAERLSLDLDNEHPARRWLEDARRPRHAYVEWLDDHAAQLSVAVEREADDTPLNVMFAHLIALVEQPMAHAFVHWRRGDAGDANVAWATSGVAMTRAGRLTRAMAAFGDTPKAPASARLSIREDPKAAIERDRELAKLCAQAAARAAESITGEIANHCRDIEAYARRLSDHRDGVHPSLLEAAPCFQSFESTLKRYVC